MTIYAYGRISENKPKDQQMIDQIEQKYPECRLFVEDVSLEVKTRPVLEEILRHIKTGDTLVIGKLDWLAHDARDLFKIMNKLESAGASLEIYGNQLTTNAGQGIFFSSMLTLFAEFEYNINEEHEREVQPETEAAVKANTVKDLMERMVALFKKKTEKNPGKQDAHNADDKHEPDFEGSALPA